MYFEIKKRSNQENQKAPTFTQKWATGKTLLQNEELNPHIKTVLIGIYNTLHTLFSTIELKYVVSDNWFQNCICDICNTYGFTANQPHDKQPHQYKTTQGRSVVNRFKRTCGTTHMHITINQHFDNHKTGIYAIQFINISISIQIKKGTPKQLVLFTLHPLIVTNNHTTRLFYTLQKAHKTAQSSI